MNAGYVIELKDVSVYHARSGTGKRAASRKNMRGQQPALSDINLRVKRGELVYFIGRVGTGKSTLLKTLYGEVELGSGEAYIAGYDLSRLHRKDIPHLRRRMGIVFQDHQLLTDRNVFNNLHYVMRATGWRNEVDIKRRVEELLGMVGLTGKMNKMPYELSGGEQQRLAIARALINNPEVILADEPTGNLDPAAADTVMNIFCKIAEMGCAVVMSTHNVSIIGDYPARTIRFNQGRIEEIDVPSLLAGE